VLKKALDTPNIVREAVERPCRVLEELRPLDSAWSGFRGVIAFSEKFFETEILRFCSTIVTVAWGFEDIDQQNQGRAVIHRPGTEVEDKKYTLNA